MSETSSSAPPPPASAPFTDLVEVSAERFGGAVIAANDEFFAPKERLLLPNAAEWREGVYTERGKWMDGWETRRRRVPGHDWCVVRLGLPARVHGIVVETTWFRGNFPEACSFDACQHDPASDAVLATQSRTWTEILPRSLLAGHASIPFAIDHASRVTHLRFNIYPDGGVARLRVFGDVVPDQQALSPGREVNLAAIELGAFVPVCSDMFFGHRQNLILPGRSTHMGDGWETKRRRGPGYDWSIVRLAARGAVERVEIDTDHYKGNAPESCSLEIIDAAGTSTDELAAGKWNTVLQRTPLQPHSRHAFPIAASPTATHVRLNIFPDGGIARLRVFGRSLA